MRRRISTVSLAILTFVSTGCGSKDAVKSDAAPAGATAAKTDKAADVAALRAIYQKMPQYAASASIDSMMPLFADDATEMMAGMPRAKGPDAIRKTMTAAFGSLKNPKMSFGDVEVQVADAGDLAVVAAPYQVSFTGPDGKAQQDHGTSMTVFKKVNGQWKILYDTNVSEVAPPQ